MIVKSTTKKGQNLIATCNRNEGFRLRDVYGSYSYAKEQAWNYCFEKYLKEKETKNAENFHICSHNAQTFSVAWWTDEGYQLETAYNSYTII